MIPSFHSAGTRPEHPADTLEQRMQCLRNTWKGIFEEFRYVGCHQPVARPFFSFFTALTTSCSVGSSVHISMSGVAAEEAASSSEHTVPGG